MTRLLDALAQEAQRNLDWSLKTYSTKLQTELLAMKIWMVDEKLIKKSDMLTSENTLLMVLSKYFHDHEYCMIFWWGKMEENLYKTIKTFLIEVTKEQFLPSASTMTTSTSSMIASTLTRTADVQSLTSSEPSLDELVESVCVQSTSALNTGSILSYTSIKRGEKILKLSLPESTGSHIIKIEIYPMKDCQKTDTKNWWKHAPFRSCFTVPSPMDPRYIQAEAMIKKHLLQLRNNPNTDRKEIGSSNSYTPFQQRQ